MIGASTDGQLLVYPQIVSGQLVSSYLLDNAGPLNVCYPLGQRNTALSNPADLPRLCFGRFEVDLRTAEIFKEGKRIKLQKQPCQVLVLLTERPGELVSREELRKKLWPNDTFVDFDHGMNVAINKLRETLGDSPEKPRFIETLPRRGYRFIAPVAPCQKCPSAQTVSSIGVLAAPAPPPEALAVRRPVKFWIAAGTVAAILALLVGFDVGGLRHRFLRTSAARGMQSIAVLPLENISGDPSQEYFADGMTEALITELGKIGELRVISHTSARHYKGTRKTLPEIAHELNVDAVIEGAVLLSGNRVRITAQLVEAPNDRHLWAGSYERELRDVLTLQTEVARAIAVQTRANLSHQQLQFASRRDVNPEAYDYYLKGRYNCSDRVSEQGYNNAIRYFEMALEKDPNYAAPYAALAHCYVSASFFQGQELRPREVWSKAAAAAKKALELDDQLGEAHIAMATVFFRFDWNWPDAEREFRRGLELGPNEAFGHLNYGLFLGIMGRLDEAIAEVTRARDLDPLSPFVSHGVSWIYTWSRRSDEAIAEAQRTLQLDPNFIAAHTALAWNYEEKRMYDEAVSEWLKWHALAGHSQEQIDSLRNAFAASGIKGFWEKSLEWEKLQRNQPHYFILARLCVRLGRTDEAFYWLEKAYEARYQNMPNIKVAAVWLDPVRSDPRYAELIRRLGLPP